MLTQIIAPRVSVPLDDEARAALREICNQEVRPPQWTLRWLIMQEAQRRGILNIDTEMNNRDASISQAERATVV